MAAYDAASIRHLEGLDAVRKRPGMYIGATDSRGLQQLLWELLDNAVDEAAEGHGDQITVTLHSDRSYSVADHGRGVPVGPVATADNRSALDVVFTELHAGGKFGTAAYKASGGLHGVGAATVNALSERLAVETIRDGKLHRLDFQQGEPGHSTNGQFKQSGTPRARRVAKGRAGTRVRFWPDYRIFPTDTEIDPDTAADRCQQTAWLLPAVQITLDDRRNDTTTTFRSPAGLADCVRAMLGNAVPLCKVINIEAAVPYTDKVVDGTTVTETERICEVRLALVWARAHPGQIRTFVNTMPTAQGGTHLTGLEQAVTNELRQTVRQAAPTKLRKHGDKATVTKPDALHGLVAALQVRLPEPQFDSQTKDTLGTAQVTSIVRTVVRNELARWFQGDHPDHTKTGAAAVVRHVTGSVLARIAAERAANLERKQTRLSASLLPAKLADCARRTGNELLIVEGDSAAGPAKRARDAQWQAVLPLRGKIINAAKSSAAQIVNNNEVSALVVSIGGGHGSQFDLKQVRYDRVVLLADADIDGAHIRCLLLTLFWCRMRPLLDAGRLYTAVPPTHALAYGKRTQFVFGDRDLQRATTKLERRRTAFTVTRFKGLGEMDDDELRSTCLHPTTRRLRRITANDAKTAAAAFDTLMGRDAAKRRSYVTANAGRADGLLDL